MSVVDKARQLANSLRKQRIDLQSELSNEQLLLIYITSLERELRDTSPYRIGKSWPGRKSIEGLALISILRNALAVTKHLGEKEIDQQSLLIDMSYLHQSLEQANVFMIHEEKI